MAKSTHGSRERTGYAHRPIQPSDYSSLGSVTYWRTPNVSPSGVAGLPAERH
jgi:hypothetical protein